VARAIINLVAAQNELSVEICMGLYAYPDPPVDIGAALEKRARCALKVLQALLLETESIWTPQNYGRGGRD
jgi:hypothetical protein